MRLTKEQKKQIQAFTKKLLEEEKQKDFLINHQCDWGFLEQLVQKANDNPGLKIEIILADGTKLNLRTYRENRRKDPIESFNFDEL